MIDPCYTELQLIHNLIVSLCQSKGLQCTSKQSSTEIIHLYIANQNQPSPTIDLRIIQIETIIKFHIRGKGSLEYLQDSLWVNSKNHISKKLGNTFSLHNISNPRIETVIDTRIFKLLSKNLLGNIEKVLEEPAIAVNILKFLKYKNGEQILILNRGIYKSLSSNGMYKGMYEAKFGKTGFGMNLDWKKNYIKKCRQRENN